MALAYGMIKLGASDPTLKVGGSAVLRMYRGGQLVYPTDTTAPPSPKNVIIIDMGGGAYNLQWAVGFDSGGSGLQGYKVYHDGVWDNVIRTTLYLTISEGDGYELDDWYVTAIDYANNESVPSDTVTWNPVVLTSFSSSLGQANSSGVCDLIKNQTYYHDGSGSKPVVGDNVYTDLAGTTALADNHYALVLTYMKILNGSVSSITGCPLF